MITTAQLITAEELLKMPRGRFRYELVRVELKQMSPDLAVEVMSPDDTVKEVDEKAKKWLAAGASMVWVVNPKRRTVTVYRSPADVTKLTENYGLDGEAVVPGFRSRVSEIFA